jgi:hypothetical protein
MSMTKKNNDIGKNYTSDEVNGGIKFESMENSREN